MDSFVTFCAEYLIVGIALASAVLIASSRRGRMQLMALLAVALPLGYLLARLAGMFFSHEQPFAAQGFEPLIAHDIDNSFPSDHALISGVFATISFLADTRIGLVLWALAGLVGAARMAAGLHYAVDVIAAFGIALFAVWVASVAVSSFFQRGR